MLKKNNFKKYVSIIKGQFSLKCDQDTPGASSRENKNGDLVYELLYDQLEGVITNIEFVKGKYGEKIDVTIKDSEEVVLNISWKDFSVRDRFIKCLPNVNFCQPIVFKTFQNDQGKTVFLMYQEGQLIKQKWTKDNPGDFPQPKQTKNFDGSTKWDFSECEAFLYQVLQDQVNRLEDFEDTGIVEFAEETFKGEPA